MKIPYELQIVLVAGYLAYKIISIGKGRIHRTEDFLLQVLSFGVVSRSATAAILWLFPKSMPIEVDEAVSIALVAVLTCAVATVLGMLWRAFGEGVVRSIMNVSGVYRDDHESSVWQSIMNQPAKWTVVQIFLEDGLVLEANFGQMKPFPRVPIIMNEDGIATYVTGRYREDNSFESYDITGNDGDITLTYVPRSSIKRVDVSWRLPDRHIIASEISA
ncbi:hypothetical protein J2857_003113 [Neorhizobium galegae]|uniref:hypothetical protein n=1 Tax=Neorhizobium galegae TaxID=399 RepID=UPI001AE28217|nr:hypothetical protein [Neorhizobium galegae]MBP2560344.1 hypothetical protein [Neorhizobium galegae]